MPPPTNSNIKGLLIALIINNIINNSGSGKIQRRSARWGTLLMGLYLHLHFLQPSNLRPSGCRLILPSTLVFPTSGQMEGSCLNDEGIHTLKGCWQYERDTNNIFYNGDNNCASQYFIKFCTRHIFIWKVDIYLRSCKARNIHIN